MILSEIGDGVVIRVMACGKYPEGDVFVGSLFYLSGRGHPHAVGIEEKLYHHGRVIRRLALESRAVSLLNVTEVKFINHFRDKVGKVTLRQPLFQ